MLVLQVLQSRQDYSVGFVQLVRQSCQEYRVGSASAAELTGIYGWLSKCVRVDRNILLVLQVPQSWKEYLVGSASAS